MSKSESSFLYSGNAAFVEQLYETYLHDAEAVEPEWRNYFAAVHGDGSQRDIAHSKIQHAFLTTARRKGSVTAASPDTDALTHQKQVSVLQLINAYRFRGHQQADLDPLKHYERPKVPELDPAYHNLSQADLDTKFNS
ncbi:MAG: 2-oxoglutarate dehydrogenase E1 subunit family protein, partial [Gammaproteobacteria bacterium]